MEGGWGWEVTGRVPRLLLEAEAAQGGDRGMRPEAVEGQVQAAGGNCLPPTASIAHPLPPTVCPPLPPPPPVTLPLLSLLR